MATQLFAAKITRARFTLSPFTSEQMHTIGNVLANNIKTRILSGKNAIDQESKALKPNYAKFKMKRGRAPIRDWYFSGNTLGSLQVKSANENRVVVGFTSAKYDHVAHLNNLREKAFGISPEDMKAVNRVVLTTLLGSIRFAKVA